MSLVWAVILTLIGLGFVLAEVFFPSLGLLGLIAGTSILGADLLAFDHSHTAGWIFIACQVVLIPTVVWLGFKALPHLSFGRRMLLEGPVTEPRAGLPDFGRYLDRRGVAATDLRPAGTGRFDEERVSVVSVGGMIDRGTPVVVVAVEGAEVRVRPAPTPEDSPSASTAP